LTESLHQGKQSERSIRKIIVTERTQTPRVGPNVMYENAEQANAPLFLINKKRPDIVSDAK